MNYHVLRGMREIVASSHRMTKLEWADTQKEFDGRCAYCGEVPTAENRGVVADHLIPVTAFGELVVGNTVPACQTCNDSRGNKDWRTFIKSRHPHDGASRIAKIEGHIGKYNYNPCGLEDSLTLQEQEEYRKILKQWEEVLEQARALKLKVNARKSLKGM
ncbi:HNH endonuclease [Pseudomonas sp. CLCA07]